MSIFIRTAVHVVLIFVCAVQAQAQIGPEGKQLPKAEELIIRPYVQYHVPGQATIAWKTSVPSPTILGYGSGEGDRISATDATLKTEHEVVVENLLRDTVYLYNITTENEGKETTSVDYSLDTTFNYTVVPIPADINPYGDDATSAMYAKAAQQIIAETGITSGYCLVYGSGRGQLALELAKRTQLIVQGVDDDPKAIAEGRNILGKAGLYGDRITLVSTVSLDQLPFTSKYANLVVSDRALVEGEMPGTPLEVLRVLRPGGGIAYFGRPDSAKDGVASQALNDWLGITGDSFAVSQNTDGLWAKSVAPPLPNIGAWSHQYGDAANTSNSGDTLSGAGKTNEMRVQWLGRPGADFGIDRNPRMPAPLSINGRLFHQGLNRMCGLDAYNGAMLWMLEVPGLRRVNIPRDGSNWCADADQVFVAIEGAMWAVDAQTGNLDHLYALPDGEAKGSKEWGIVMQEDDRIFGSSTKTGSSYTTYWGGPAWYDSTSGAGTFKVCSDSLFSYEKGGTKPDWTYRSGMIINSTVTMAEGKIYFVESRHPAALASESGRIEADELWLDQYLVALDAKTGKTLWEESIDTEDGVVVFFLTHTNDTLLLTSSLSGNYHLYAFNSKDGSRNWHSSHKWVSDNHGSHMIHPAVVADVVFLEPLGYSVTTGEVLRDDLGRREGCATVAATSDALIYRGANRRVAMWDIASGEVTSWMNLRPSCWLSVVPSGGMILAPEGGGGCSCGNWVETSLGFLPDLPATD
ncbi:MAG: PQQ-binding-like beta-propeller repeat protein [Candidatus Hydrogenedentota bacterium]